MEILIIIGKGIIWFIGGIVISTIVSQLYNHFSDERDPLNRSMGGYLIHWGTFVLYVIGTAVFFIVF